MPRMKSTAVEAQEGIVEYIRSHGLVEGDVLPSEQFLCEELGLSRTSIREAMRTLTSLDIVEVRHGHGTYVSKMSLRPLVRAMTLRIMLQNNDSLSILHHVLQMRRSIGFTSAEELSRIWKGADISELEDIVEEMRVAAREDKPFELADRKFHQAVLRDVSNPFSRELSDAFWEIQIEVLPQLNIAFPRDIEATIETHARIAEALGDGDLDRLRLLIDEHYDPLFAILEEDNA